MCRREALFETLDGHVSICHGAALFLSALLFNFPMFLHALMPEEEESLVW